jgi:hypothetical protein
MKFFYRLIFGFCSKDEAELLLREMERPTLLIRFSDIEFGKLKVSVKDRMGVIRHHWYDYSSTHVMSSLSRELLSNSKYYGVEFIYPNIDFAKALGARTQTVNDNYRKPRNLQPTPVYFDNQDAAMTTF